MRIQYREHHSKEENNDEQENQKDDKSTSHASKHSNQRREALKDSQVVHSIHQVDKNADFHADHTWGIVTISGVLEPLVENDRDDVDEILPEFVHTKEVPDSTFADVVDKTDNEIENWVKKTDDQERVPIVTVRDGLFTMGIVCIFEVDVNVLNILCELKYVESISKHTDEMPFDS